MGDQSKFGRLKLHAKTSCSILALIAAPHIAMAACAPNPAQDYTTTTCDGAETNGFIVSTNGSTVNINTGATVSSSDPNSGAVTITRGVQSSPYYYTYSYQSTLNDAGTIDGGSQAGIVIDNGVNNSSNAYYNTLSPIVNVQSGGAVGGQIGIAIRSSQGPSQGYGAAVTLNNSGTISGNGGVALYANVSSGGYFQSINNAAGGKIGAISAAAQSLINAGTIDGGGVSAFLSPVSTNYTTNITNQSTGVIQSNSSSATLAFNDPSPVVSNAGVITNSGGGAAISALNALSLTNVGGVINGDIIAGGPSSISASTIDDTGGTINGSIQLGAANDRVIADYGTSANPIKGITGTIDAGGGTNTLQLNISSNTTLTSTLAPPATFQRASYGVGGGLTLTLAAGSDLTSTVYIAGLSGAGSVVNNADITTTGPAFAADGYNFGAPVTVTNNGQITANLSNANAYAISNGSYGLGAFTNTGSLTAIGGSGLNAEANVTNSGTITADGTAVNEFDGVLNNSGVIHSNSATGFYGFGNSGTQATNSGTIYGQLIGAEILGYTLTNSGTISSPNISVSTDPYSTLINLKGGIINGEISSTLYSYGFNTAIINGGTINGNVNLGEDSSYYGSNNTFVAQPGSILNGDLTLGGGNDLFVTSLINNGPGQFAGVTGTVTGSGTETIRYLVTADATTTLAPTALFSVVGYDLSNNAKLSITAASSQALRTNFAGTGIVDISVDLTGDGVSGALIDMTHTSEQTTGSPATTVPTLLNVTSHGTLTQIKTSSNSYFGTDATPAVALSGASIFTNAGTIIAQDLAPPQSGISLAAISGGGTVVNIGTISVASAYGVYGGGFYSNPPLSVINNGIINQLAGGGDGVGIASATSVTNTGSISTGGSAVVFGATYSVNASPPSLINSGQITSVNAAAVESGPSYSPSQTVFNQSSGVISGPISINLVNGGLVDNAGVLNGDVDLGATDQGTGTYVDRGGKLNGDLNFGNFNNIFVSIDGAMGVTGAVNVNGGANTFARGYTADSTVSPLATSPIQGFNSTAIGALGDDVTVTVNSVSGGVNFSPSFFGSGEIINNTDVNTAMPGGLNNVQLGFGYTTATSSSLIFVNNATLADGVSGSASDFTNTGTIGSTLLPFEAVNLSPPSAGGAFKFNNTGSISAFAISSYYYGYTIEPTIHISNIQQYTFIPKAEIYNSGYISGGEDAQLLSDVFYFNNSGIISGIDSNSPQKYYDLSGVSLTLGQGEYYSSPAVDTNATTATIINTGSITDGLLASVQSLSTSFTNSGTIDAGADSLQAVSLVIPGHQTLDPTQGVNGVIDQVNVTVMNQGQLLGDMSLNSHADAVGVTNSGSIIDALKTSPIGYLSISPALDIANSTLQAQSVNINNSGDIETLHTANTALYVNVNSSQSTSSVTVDNSGTVRSDAGSRLFSALTLDNFSDELDTASALTVIATGQGASAISITNAAGGVISSTGPLTNDAIDTSAALAASHAGSVAVFASADTVNIVNSGQINGGGGLTVPTGATVYIAGQTVTLPNQYLAGAIQTIGSTDTIVNTKTGVINGSIDLGAGNDTLSNYGTINGDVYLRSGDNHFIEGIGAILNGVADGGTGANELTIDTTGGGTLNAALFSKFVNFQTLDFVGGGAVMFSGSASLPVPTITLDSGANLTIAAGQTLQTAGPTTITGAGSVNFTNLGVISGDVVLSGGGNQLTNAGAITGSVTFSGGGNQVTLQPGASFGGPVSAGSGINTLVLAEDGTDANREQLNLSQFSGFTSAQVNSGVSELNGTFNTGELDIVGGRLIGAPGSSITAPLITVSRGATFGSAGIVVGNIQVNGTLSPGASPNVMTVTGNVALTSTSTSLFELTPTISDKLLVSGAVTIAPGATLNIVGSHRVAPGASIDLIVASGGLTGDFTTITKPADLLGFVAKRGNALDLFGLFATGQSYTAPVNASINTLNTLLINGQASENLLNALPVLLNADESSNATAFAKLAPQPYASASRIGTENGLTISRALRDDDVSAHGDATQFFSYLQGMGYWRPLPASLSYGASRADISAGGLIGGLGVGSKDTAISGFIGNLDANQALGALGAQNKSNGVIFGVHAGVNRGRWVAQATLAYDDSAVTTTRVLPGATSASSHYGLHSATFDASVGYAVPLNAAWAVTPRLGYTHVRTDELGGAESSPSPFALTVAEQIYNSDFVDGELKLARAKDLVGGFNPWISVGARHDINNEGRSAAATLVGATTPFVAAGDARQAWLGTVGAGVSWSFGRVSVYAAYKGEFDSDGASHTMDGGLKMQF